MKQILLLLLFAVLNTSCKRELKQSNDASIETTEVSEIKMARPPDSEGLISVLSKTTPFTEDQFRHTFPKSIKNLQRDAEVQIINRQGYATYGNGKLTLAIHDCAGKNYGMATTFETIYNIKAQDNEETQYSNKIRAGIKTINTFRVKNNQSDIVFLHNNRWYVVLGGKAMNPDQLWDAFDLNVLKNYQ